MSIIRNALIIIVPAILLTFLIGKGLSLFVKNERILKLLNLVVLLLCLLFFTILVMTHIYKIND